MSGEMNVEMSAQQKVAENLRSAITMLEGGKMTESTFIEYVRNLMDDYYEALNTPAKLLPLDTGKMGEVDARDVMDFD